MRLRHAASLLALPALLLALAAAPSNADLVRKQPYLVYLGDPTQMRVLWQLTGTDTTRIEWGTDLAYSLGTVQTSEYGTDHQHGYTITGLTPGTKVYYRVWAEGTPYPGSFTAMPPASATSFEFIAYGDTRSYPATHNTVAGQILSAIGADPALQTFAVTVGDAVANGTLETAWDGELFSPTYTNIRTLMASVPWMACMGNHETYGGGTAGTLFPKYFPYAYPNIRYYYSFDAGPAHFAVLDQYTDFSVGSAQYNWLVGDLAATDRLWKFVVLHEPGWSAGGGHLNNTTVQNALQPLFQQYGVAIVFGGHNHYYARAAKNGVQHLTVGGGGAPLAVPDPYYPNVVRVSQSYHYATVAIDDTVLRFRAINTAGTLIDSFTFVRDRVPPVVQVTSPVGGELWQAGTTQPITWTAADARGVFSVDLRYSTDGGATFPNAIATGIANSGSYDWLVPGISSSSVRVKAVARDTFGNVGADSSHADFAISGHIIVASAGSGGTIVPSGNVPVAEGADQAFSIRPGTGFRVGTLTVDGGPVTPDTTYIFSSVVVNHTIAATFADTLAPAVAVTSPAGGETWNSDEARTITWTATDNVAVDSVTVDWSRDGAGGPWQTIARGIPNSGSLGWTVPRPGTTTALVRVTAWDHSKNVRAAAGGTFTIVDPLVGVAPGGPARLALERPSPDPSTGGVRLAFSLPAAGRVRLEVHDVAGRRVWGMTAELAAGRHAWEWNGVTLQGTRAGSGRYFVRLVTPWGTRTERMSRLR